MDLNTLSSIKPPMLSEVVFPIICRHFGWAFIVAWIFHETLITSCTSAIKYSLSKNTSTFIIAMIYLLLTSCTIQFPPLNAKVYLPSADVYCALPFPYPGSIMYSWKSWGHAAWAPLSSLVGPCLFWSLTFQQQWPVNVFLCNNNNPLS